MGQNPSLPQMHHVLQEQADAGDADPAAKSHKEGLSASFDQLYDVGVEADGSHGQHDEELGKLFDRGEEVRRHTHGSCHSSNDGGSDEI